MLTPPNMDLRVIAHWVSRRLEAIEHEQRVVRIATTLFDLTIDLHDLGASGRNLLRAAALVHDVGRSIDKARHPQLGARMIVRDRSLQIEDCQRRALAFLTLYHRGAVPRAGSEALLRDGDDRGALRQVLALLRAADALDSRSLESPHLVFGLKKKRIQVDCYLREACGRARRVYLRRKKFRLLEEEMGCTVAVDVRSVEALTLVA